MIDIIVSYPTLDRDDIEDFDSPHDGWRLWVAHADYFGKRPKYYEGYMGDENDPITYKEAMAAMEEDHSEAWKEYYDYCIKHGEDPLDALGYVRTSRTVKRRGKVLFNAIDNHVKQFGFPVMSFTVSGKTYTQRNLHKCPAEWLRFFEIKKTDAPRNPWRFTGAYSVNELTENYGDVLCRGGIQGTGEFREPYRNAADNIRRRARKLLRAMLKKRA